MDKGVEQEKRMEWGWQWRQGGLYQELQEALNELELPPTLTDTPKSALSYSELCVCVLGSPLPFLSLLLQMGCRSPGDSLLCLSPSWLSRPSSSSSPNDSHLLVHRAVIFDLGGRTHLLTFIPPRRVTYFLPCAPWVEVGPQQQEVIRNLGCPMGGSPELYRFWGDTLNCRKILGREGLLPTPPTLAVVIQEERESKGEGERGLWVLGVGDVAEKGDEERVREELMHFLNMPAIRATGKVVLKPSGGRWVGMSGCRRPIRFLDGRDPEAVWVELRSLLAQLQRQEAALIEAYCPSINPGPRFPHPGSQAHPVSELSMRVCAIITRSPQNIPLLYKLLCRVGLSELPLSHWDSLPQSLLSSLQDWGLGDRSIVLSLRRLLTHSALCCFRIVMDTEAQMSPGQRGGQEAQTDLIGVDMLLSLSKFVQREGSDCCRGSDWDPTVTPVILGLHPWSCLQSCCLGGGVGWRRQGGMEEEEGCVGSLLHSPLSRSQRHLLQEKRVLVVGAGGDSKAFVWEVAKEFGVEIFLVESDPNHFASRLVSHFLPLDLSDHRQDPEHCAAVVTWLRERNLQPQGVLCFWDSCTVLAALLSQTLGLPGNPPSAVLTAKEKSRTHLHLQGCLLPLSSPPPSSISAASDPYSPPSLSPLSTTSLRPYVPLASSHLTAPPPPVPANVTQPQMASSPKPQAPLLPLLSPPPQVYAVPCAHIETPDDIIRAVHPGNCPSNNHKYPNNYPSQPTYTSPSINPTPPLFPTSSATPTLNPTSFPTAQLPLPPPICFPAVLKMEFGWGAVGTRLVGSLEEALAHLEHMRGEADFPGIGQGFGNCLTLMDFLGGTEHDVDLVLSGGRLEGVFVSDNGPTRVPGFTETAAQMPTGLSQEQEARLVAAAHSCCLGCGLRDGVFNVELKLTPTGPKLIEINARMGGYYLRDWVREVFGEDLLLCAFLCALGIRPCLARPRPPTLCHLTGVMGLLSQHKQQIMNMGMGRLRELHQRGVIRLCEFGVEPGWEGEGLRWQEEVKEKEKMREGQGLQQQQEQQKGEGLQQRQRGDESPQEGIGLQQEGVILRGLYEEPFCSIGVKAEGGVESRLGLLTVSRVLGLDTSEYPVTHFLSHFH
ncbi:carnosine synthase 1 [Amia ocellicauda]|uniref:carnosine synthase 1 n=1 Tax=Amia ocellicauda TaxID=2972642 RepID=UPI003464AEEF